MSKLHQPDSFMSHSFDLKLTEGDSLVGGLSELGSEDIFSDRMCHRDMPINKLVE
jgi:hypothetical protein